MRCTAACQVTLLMAMYEGSLHPPLLGLREDDDNLEGIAIHSRTRGISKSGGSSSLSFGCY